MLENDVNVYYGNLEGIYTYQGFINEMPYWVDAEEENAIWYMAYGSSYDWEIGPLVSLGSSVFDVLSTSTTLEKKCPYNEGYVWPWYFNHIDTLQFFKLADVQVKCSNEDDFCTSANPCGLDQGDCDTHDECQDGSLCGSNNCPNYLGFHSDFDCCYTQLSTGCKYH